MTNQPDLGLPIPIEPLIPEAWYAVGLDCAALTGPHAVRHTDIMKPPDPREAPAGVAVCGTPIAVVRTWGETWDACLNSRPLDACPVCLWTVATTHATTRRVLRYLTPPATDTAAFIRACGDPAPAATVCRAILASEDDDGGTEAPLTLQLLAHATTHRPVLTVADEDCAEGTCEHDNVPSDCYVGTALCNACSVTAGPWANEYEGQIAIQCCVASPCSPLLTLARHYRIILTTPTMPPASNGATA